MGFIWVDDKEDDKKFKKHMEDEINKATASLSASNEGLKKDISKLKKKVKEKADVDVSEFNKLKMENEELKNKKKKNESENEKALRLALENANKKLDNFDKKLKEREQKDIENTITAQISKGLSKINVKPALIDAAAKIIKADVSVIEDDEGEKKIVIGDKSIKEYIKEWSESDEGKNFILAKKNKGGNGQGSGDGDDKGNYDQFFDKKSGKYNITQQVMLKKSNPDEYKRLMEKYSSK